MPQPRTNWAPTAEEFDFFTRHPGGFDRQFFNEHLVPLLMAFMQANGIDDASDVEIVVRLENDDELVVLHAFPALTWVAFKTSDELRAVPMTAVHEVRARRRAPDETTPRQVGFAAVEPVDQASHTHG